MHAGLFDMFHDPTDDEIASGIANGVDVYLGGIFKEAIYKHWSFSRESAFFTETSERRELRHCNPKTFIVVDNFHCPAAEDVTRTNKNRVTDS